MAGRSKPEVIVVSDEDSRPAAASGRSSRRQEDPTRPRYERPPARKQSSASGSGSGSPKKHSSPKSVKTSPSTRPQLARGASPLNIEEHLSPSSSSRSAHRSVQSLPHPALEAKRQQDRAVALRLYKEQLRKEQDELAEAIERSIAENLSPRVSSPELEEIISSDDDEDIIDLTALQPILFPPQRATPGSTRRERRKQERRVSRLEDRLKELEMEEMHVAQEYEDLQTALAMSIAQEEKDREALERKTLRDEQQAAYMESLAKDRAREEEEKRLADEKRRAEEAEQRRIEEEEAKRRKIAEEEEAKRQRIAEELERAAQANEEVGPETADAVELVLRLPDGQRVPLRFAKHATVGALARAAVRLGMPAGTFELMTDFPRKVFADFARPLAEEGLTQRALVSVRPKHG